MNSLNKIREAVRSKYAWPGGYPLVILMADGETICCDCARREWRLLVLAKKNPGGDKQWEPMHAFINYEDNDLYCAHCNKQIESAYGEYDE